MNTTVVLDLDAERLKRDFPILSQRVRNDKRLVYLDNAATTQAPRQVIDSLVETYEHSYANVHRGIHWLSDRATDLYEDARETVGRLIHAEMASEIIFTTGTTAAINLVARSWGDAYVREGDAIVVSEMEHHSNLVPWQQLCERTGCHIRTWPVTDDGLLRWDLLPSLLDDRVRVVAITAISNVLGTVNAIPPIVEAAHRCGAIVLVDAAQASPCMNIDVQAWNADFVAFSGHKMMGPSGVGVLYGRRSWLDAMPPFLGGGSMIRRVRMDGFEPADPPAKFEAGTPPIVPAIGLKVAVDYLLKVGLDAVGRHEHRLAQYTHEQLEQIGGVRILGPGVDQKSGIVSFVVDGIHAHDVAQLLDREGIAIRAGHHCAMPLHKRLGVNSSCRASFYLYNTRDDVDQLIAGLQTARRVFRRK